MSDNEWVPPEIDYLAKDYACRQLVLVGSDASIPVLAGLLTNPRMSYMARFARDFAETLGIDQVHLIATRQFDGDALTEVALEPLALGGPGKLRVTDHLQRHASTERELPSLEDHPHAALANELQDPIAVVHEPPGERPPLVGGHIQGGILPRLIRIRPDGRLHPHDRGCRAFCADPG